MRHTPEPESSEPEGTQLEDRLIAALTTVSSHIDVAPRTFEPPTASRPVRQHAGAGRMPLRLVAAVALVVGFAGMIVMSRSPIGEDDVVVTGSGEDEGSPVDYEAPVDGSLDPDFLDYVTPTDGDEGRSAERLFVDGYTWARETSIIDCLEGTGLSHAESLWAVAMTDWYSFQGSPSKASSAQARLPALRTVAENGLDRPRQEVVSRQVRSTVDRCRETDASKASRWQRNIEPLQTEFAASVDEVIADVEAGPTWDEVRACLTESGAPPNDERGQPRAHIAEYIDWLAAAQSHRPSVAGSSPGATPSADGDGGSAESRAFARCAEPFYAEVETALAWPRNAFVAEHHHELLKLQAEFASFA